MKTLLVVDDEKNICRLYQQELCDEGYRVLVAENGNEAIDLLKKENIDLAILDIKMDGLNGIDTLKQLLALKKELKVILNSAYSIYKSDFATWLADAYLIKSSDLTELKKTIAEILQ